MKKLFVFCSSVLISFCILAQNTPVKNSPANNFCKVLSKVMANSPDNFVKIQIEQADAIPAEIYYPTGNYIGSGWNTSLNFPGALKSLISEYTTYIDESTVLYNPYSAYFGGFKTEIEATKKLNTIKKQLIECLKGYKIKIIRSDTKDSYDFRVLHVFTGKTDGLPAQTIVLQIEKILSFSLYKVYLEVKGLNSEPASLRPLNDLFFKMPALNFDTTSVSPAQPKLAKQLNQFNEQLSSIVADYAKDFATIKGERKTAWGDGDKFYSKVELQGADSVYLVQNWTTRRLSFIAIYSKHSSKEEAREKFDELVAQVGQCKFPCCTFAKTDVSELSNMVVQAWLPFDLLRKMEATYKDMMLEVEIGKRIDLVTKSGKIDMEESWQLVLRVTKL